MRRLGYQFRPALIPSLATLLLLPVFVGLGLWQLDRAEQKRALQAEYDARGRDGPIQIGARVQTAEELRFYRVIVKGYYDPDYQILLDNRVHQGRAGYHVITPLHIAGSDVRVLINRGWIPLGETRADLPHITTPDGLQEVTGLAVAPQPRHFVLSAKAEPSKGSWQPVWEYLDMKRYVEAVPFKLQPVVVLLAPANAGGFVREWARLDAGIATHQGDAFQWFTLALALLTVYLFVNTRKVGGPR
jgi:surfeit locus 1 family protein